MLEKMQSALNDTIGNAVDLSQFTTFRTQATANQLVFLNELTELAELSNLLKQQDFIVIGSGANILFADNYHGIVVVNKLQGIKIIDNNQDNVLIEVAAGENWHNFVVSMNKQGFYGLENLALIPGTVGAAPVQNIGAYGVEVADFIKSVQVFDIVEQQTKTIACKDCGFAYRDSYFKQDKWRNRYIITSVTLRLSKIFQPILSYQGLCQPNAPQTAIELLNRVIDVRKSKLPAPNNLPNAGSFFKNPVIDRKQFTELQQKYPNIPFFELGTDTIKIPAAWLIETVGYKGHKEENGAGVYDKHALILVNHKQAKGSDIYQLACDIILAVKKEFTINLVPEVRIIGQRLESKNVK